jgi:hypothetical protein
MTNWVAYYATNAIALLIFASLTAWGFYKNWDGVYWVFGFALLATAFAIVKPA